MTHSGTLMSSPPLRGQGGRPKYNVPSVESIAVPTGAPKPPVKSGPVKALQALQAASQENQAPGSQPNFAQENRVLRAQLEEETLKRQKAEKATAAEQKENRRLTNLYESTKGAREAYTQGNREVQLQLAKAKKEIKALKAQAEKDKQQVQEKVRKQVQEKLARMDAQLKVTAQEILDLMDCPKTEA